jgi:hypothetical protein
MNQFEACIPKGPSEIAQANNLMSKQKNSVTKFTHHHQCPKRMDDFTVVVFVMRCTPSLFNSWILFVRFMKLRANVDP